MLALRGSRPLPLPAKDPRAGQRRGGSGVEGKGEEGDSEEEVAMKRLAIAALLVATGFVTGNATPRDEANQRALTEARTTGEPEDCVQINRIRNTRVRDERTIDFFMNGGRVMRNTLPYECPGLAFEDRFAFETSLSRLCSVDTITVLQTGGIMRGATCGLGTFQPVELPER
jgi:hypothetical protein